LKNTRIGYTKDKDERGDLVNVDGIKNGKRMLKNLEQQLCSLCLKQINIQLYEKMTNGPLTKV